MQNKLAVFVLATGLTLSIYVNAETIIPLNKDFEDGANVLAASLKNQSALHTEHCVGCHVNITDGDGSVIYTRKDRLAQNEAELRYWVKHYADGLGLNWTDQEVSQISNYIQTQFRAGENK